MSKRHRVPSNVTTAQVSNLIDLYCFNEIHRKILKRRYLDDTPFETIAEEFNYSTNYVQKIVYTVGDKVLLHLYDDDIDDIK